MGLFTYQLDLVSNSGNFDWMLEVIRVFWNIKFIYFVIERNRFEIFTAVLDGKQPN